MLDRCAATRGGGGVGFSEKGESGFESGSSIEFVCRGFGTSSAVGSTAAEQMRSQAASVEPQFLVSLLQQVEQDDGLYSEPTLVMMCAGAGTASATKSAMTSEDSQAMKPCSRERCDWLQTVMPFAISDAARRDSARQG